MWNADCAVPQAAPSLAIPGRFLRPEPHRAGAPGRNGPALIELDDVCRAYGAGASACVALRGVTLDLDAGTFVALTGPSGSGKSTLLNVMGGLDRPSSGAVRLEGRELAGLGGKEMSELRLRRLGFVFQDANLVPVLTVAENVELPLLFRRELGTTCRKDLVARALEQVGLARKHRNRPHELSRGERQRAALARALAGNPAIVLADEPTASLDEETGNAVIRLMHDFNRERGATFVCATHDPQLLIVADRILTLRNGRVVETAK